MYLLYPFVLPGRMAPFPYTRRQVPAAVAFSPILRGGGPIYGALNPFQFGAAVIDPGALFFMAGRPIGGPSEAFRGLRAATFPAYQSVLGSGAPLVAGGPLYAGAVGIAGAPLSPRPGVGGQAWI